MFHLKSFSNSAPNGEIAPEPPSSCYQKGSSSSKSGGNHSHNNNNSGSKKKRSRRRRKTKCHNKVEPLNAPAKKQHDAPMTKRDLYFSLSCEVVRIGEDANSRLAVARVTIVNWDTEVVLDTFVEVSAPVLDLMGTGITPADVQENPQAMDFTTVRQTVERILCGKILIGYQLKENLAALGLTHPSTDVRDAAFYGGSAEEEKRTIEQLSLEILDRGLPERSERHRSIEVCIAALDLYKANRKDWEMNLIERARESEHQAQLSYHRQPAYGNARLPQSQPQDLVYTVHQPPHQQTFPGHSTVPTNFLPAAASHPYGPGTYLAHSLQQHQVMMMNANGQMQPPPRNNSSWFSLGRKPRYPQQPPAMPMAPTAQPSLSSQALEALSYPTSSFDFYDGSSAFDGSAGYEVSTDYGSSVHYADSVISESVESAMSESVVSESADPSIQENSENIPMEGQQQRQPSQSMENSSWFRFGSRKSRYTQQQREPMSVVQESIEPEEGPQPLPDSEQDDGYDFGQTGYEPPRYFESGNTEEKKYSSSWFGFKRSKSPSVGKKEKADDPSEDPSGKSEEDLQEPVLHQDDVETEPPTETMTSTKAELPGAEKQSSWFKFGRRSSMRSKSPSVDLEFRDDERRLDEVVTQQTESSDATDEDWWQEVMNQPGNNLKDDDIVPQHTEEEWTGGQPSDSLVSDSQGAGPSGSKSSTWFRFLRTQKSPSGSDPTQLDYEKESGTEVCLEQPAQSEAFERSDGTWLEEAARPFDPSCLGPAWFGSAEQPDSEKALPVALSSQFKDMDLNGLLPPRARLQTESTIPSVATDSEEEDFSREFVEGMEKNLTFLNI